MKVSRRILLAGAPSVAALAVLSNVAWDGRTVVDVTAFGARGDGTTDDSAAIQAAAAALASGGTLYFPRGVYRFAQSWPEGTAAIVVSGVSDVSVEFEPGAELFMDNLDPVARTGTGHGLLVRGPAARIALRNVHIRWSPGARRSLGDGIRVIGCPTPDGVPPTGWSGPPAPVDGMSISDCAIRASPQAGVVMHGVSDITVRGLRVIDSAADGLHFNACRRARIDDFRAVNTGDDGLALVTYFASEFSFDETAHTFAFPSLTDWSNADFAIDGVDVVGGAANGVRIAGAHRVTIGGLTVAGVRSGSAVMVDSAEPGTDVGWHYVASRAVRVDDVTATNCDTGIHLLSRPGASGERHFVDFDVQVGQARFDECGNWSVRAESLTESKASGLRIDDCHISNTSTTGGNGGVGIDDARAISLGSVDIRHSDPVVVFSAVNTAQLSVDRLVVRIAKTAPPTGDANPSVTLDDSDGVIEDLEITWSAAPSSWTAVRQSTSGRCGGEAPVTVRRLQLPASVRDPTIDCS